MEPAKEGDDEREGVGDEEEEEEAEEEDDLRERAELTGEIGELGTKADEGAGGPATTGTSTRGLGDEVKKDEGAA